MITYKFYSTSWCPSCKMMKPWCKEIAPDTEFILLDDVDEESLILLNIQSVPVIIKYQDGHEVGRITGGRSKADVIKFMKE